MKLVRALHTGQVRTACGAQRQKG